MKNMSDLRLKRQLEKCEQKGLEVVKDNEKLQQRCKTLKRMYLRYKRKYENHE